jgi:hypothetical protein
MLPVEPTDTRAASGEEPALVALPGFLSGGRVHRSGIALVHEDEFILPAPGSEAVITPEADAVREGQVINYYFPVEVELVGTLTEAQMQSLAKYVYNDLINEMASWR